MNKRILYVAIGLMLLSSCSIAYKTGQTPDDVYYSPGDGLLAIVPTTDSNSNTSYYDPSYSLYPGSFYNNYPCYYTPYYDGYIYNHYYNSYYYPYPVYTKTYTAPYVNTTPRMVNLNSYNNNTYNNSNVASGYLLHPQPLNTTTIKSGTPATGNKIGAKLERIFSSPAGYDNNNAPSYNNNSSNNNNNSNYNTNSDRNYSPTNGGNNNSDGGSRPARNGR